MAVEVYGLGGEIDGYGDSMDAFRQANEQNSRILLNVMDREQMKQQGVPQARWPKKNDPRPAHDPQHPDNQWPVMVYHPALGYKAIGDNLKGLVGVVRTDTEKRNDSALKMAKAEGWRLEPYPKPQIAVLDPAAEKAALVARNVELEGKVVVLTDMFEKLSSKLDALVKEAK